MLVLSIVVAQIHPATFRTIQLLQRGFTVLELLIVIAIMGILASIVIVSLSDSREESEDAAIMSTLVNMRTDAHVYYETHDDTFSGACSTSHMQAAYDDVSAMSPGDVVCNNNDQSWLMAADLHSDEDGDGMSDYFCVDSAGSAEKGEGDVVIGQMSTQLINILTMSCP